MCICVGRMHVRTENSWEEGVSVENDILVITALPWGDWKITGPEANYLDFALGNPEEPLLPYLHWNECLVTNR